MYCERSLSSFRAGSQTEPRNGVLPFWKHLKADAMNLSNPTSVRRNRTKSWPFSKPVNPLASSSPSARRKTIAGTATGATLGDPIQLLCQRCPLGPNVRAHVSLFSLLRSSLPQPAPLAGPAHAGRKNKISTVFQCLLTVPSAPTIARTGRLPDPTRPAELWPEMANGLYSLFYSPGEKRGWLPASFVLCPSRVLRQPDL